MADAPEQRFEAAQNKLLSALSPAMALTNQSELMSMAATYLIETAFRFITLGSRIRREIENAQLALDASVKSEGIFRAPIHVNLDNTMVRNFWFKGKCKLLYPDAYQAMAPERTLMVEGTEEQKKEAWKILQVAYRVIPDIAEDNEFTDPLLNNIVGKWIDPGNKNIREIVLDLTPLLSQKELSMQGLKDTLESYAFQKLEFHKAQLQKLSLQQLNAVNEAISNLVWESFQEEDNSVDKTLDFLVNKRLIEIDEEILALKAERDKLESSGDDPSITVDSRAQEKEQQRIESRIEELEAFKARLESVGK